MSKSYSYLFKRTKGANITKDHVDFYVGSNGKALKARYKHWIGVNRRERLLKKAKNQKLRNAIDQLYRKGSFIGDGGTASALKFEYSTGLGLGKNGNFHTQKALDTIKFIDNKILSDKSLSMSDRKLAMTIKKNLLRALWGKRK